MDEMFDDKFSEEQDMLPVLKVRVLDCTKKSRIRVRRLTNFPIAETMDDMKSALQVFMPDITYPENWEIGYVLDRNKKYTIETNGELQDAHQEFKKGYQMCLDPTPAKPVVSKRQSGTSANGKKHFPIYGSLKKLVSLDFFN